MVLNDTKVAVNLDSRTCDCRAWEMKGMPCVHAIACINSIRGKVDVYCDKYFKTEYWKKCFTGIVHPIRSRTYWPTFPAKAMLQIPLPKPMTGRPKVHRRRDINEKGPITTRSTTFRCRACNQ